MDTNKRDISRRKVNKKVNKKRNPGKAVAKGFWVSFVVLLKTVFACIIIAGCIAGGLLIGVVAGCIITTEPLTEEQLDIKNSTALTSFVYDSEGNELVHIKGTANVNRQLADIEEIPENLKNAFIAIEDERFYSHSGIDVKRSIGAFLGYVIPSLDDYGGSTITQQLVKNITGDDKQSVQRKIREQWRAIRLEKELDKDEILELYLNIIYMGQDLYGVKSASLAYFSKDVSELDLAECAFLAGITNSPNRYNPLTQKGRTNCYARQINILDQMLKLGFISDEEYIEAIQEELVINDNYRKEVEAASIYSYFVDAALVDVREALMRPVEEGGLGYTREEAIDLIYQGGINIYTTMDPDIQKIVDYEYCNLENFPVNHLYTDPADMAQSSIVIINQWSGHVVAMYGGFGEKTQSLSFNYATSARRQPGSSIKPILVYGPLIDQHIINDTSIVHDEKVYLDDKNPDKPWPTNSYGYYNGAVTVRWALQQSSNVAAVQLYKDHVKENLEYLKKLGIDRTSETQLSLALGGFNKGVTTEEMAAAYVPFANGGTFYKPITFTKVTDINGRTILTNNGSPTVIYQDYRTAALMTDLLKSVVSDGTGRGAQIYNANGQAIPTAGKTGTTTDNYDYWFCGYTPYYTASVWYGYEMQKSMSSAEGGAARKLWTKVMTRIHEDLEYMDFDGIGNIMEVSICSSSNKLATEACRAAGSVTTGHFAAGYEPTELCTVHVSEPASPSPAAGTAAPTP